MTFRLLGKVAWKGKYSRYMAATKK